MNGERLRVRSLTFDVGGTLIRPWPSVGHVYASAARRYGYSNINPEILNRQFTAAWKAKTNFDHSRHAWLQLVQKAFAGSAAAAGIEEFFDNLYQEFAGRQSWRIFDDVFPTLEELRRRGFRLGIISNWDERLRPLLAELDLSPYFESIVISVEAGYVKPERQIFETAISSLAVPAQSILHVGDSPTEDLAGAQAAGLNALFLDRNPPSRGSSIASLAELLGLVNSPFD